MSQLRLLSPTQVLLATILLSLLRFLQFFRVLRQLQWLFANNDARSASALIKRSGLRAGKKLSNVEALFADDLYEEFFSRPEFFIGCDAG
jgi:hypothetical protein